MSIDPYPPEGSGVKPLPEPVRIEVVFDHHDPILRALIAIDYIIDRARLSPHDVRAVCDFIAAKHTNSERKS